MDMSKLRVDTFSNGNGLVGMAITHVETGHHVRCTAEKANTKSDYRMRKKLLAELAELMRHDGVSIED